VRYAEGPAAGGPNAASSNDYTAIGMLGSTAIASERSVSAVCFPSVCEHWLQ
jgi:hypothetical protein